MAINNTQATISLQLIELDYTLKLCAQDPNRFFSWLYYRTSNRLFKFNINENGKIKEYLSSQNGRPAEPFNAWKSLYDLACLHPRDASQDDFLGKLRQVIESLTNLAALSPAQRLIDPLCADLSQRIECLKKISDLVRDNSSYPRKVIINEVWACPLLARDPLGELPCGYGCLSFAYKTHRGFLNEEGLSRLPQPERVIYEYLFLIKGNDK